MPEVTATGTDERGPLHAIHHALRALPRKGAAIRPRDIEAIEAYWFTDGPYSCSGGFILRLLNGSRAYLDVWIEPADYDEPNPAKVDIDLTKLVEGQRYPRFPSTSDPIGGWRHNTEALNDFLSGFRSS